MQPAPILPNESERLAALRRYDILDMPAESDFDDFTRLASQICGTPIATITFVDAARQWFKSNIGLELSETPRDISFCGHAIAGSELLEVPNALEDERFRDNPLVTGEPNIRFYAGAPLITPDGLKIGALCVLDRAPHHLAPAQREMLTLLSRQVVHLLELRLAGQRIKWLNNNLEYLVTQRTEELRESEERFRTLAEQLRLKNEMLEEDLEMARELQNAMLPQQYPRFPATASEANSIVQFCHFYKSSMLVSGDFFDVFKISETMAGVFICDVMGHGVRAALVAAMLRTLVMELREAWESPSELLEQLNRMLCGNFKNFVTPIFASAFYLVVDFGRGELHYANAGHPHPLRMRRSSGSANLHELNGIKSGPALGLLEKAQYKSSRCELRAKDVILLFTDGLFEVEGLRGEYYDYNNLLKAVGRLSSLPTRDLCEELIHEVRQFSLSKEFTDDVCLVGLEVNLGSSDERLPAQFTSGLKRQ